MRDKKFSILAVVALVASLTLAAVPVSATTTPCTFTTVGSTMTLDADCTTDATIVVPDGYTLEGNGYTITAVDPDGGHFLGAVIRNGGSSAYVKNVTVTASGLSNECDKATDRLSGIRFLGASGSITNTTVIGINQGASGCQEGNAIDVRNPPFNGSGDNTVTVEIAYNYVDDWQKTGILTNGDMTVSIHHNFVGDSANQDYLAANSIQVADGVEGSVLSNRIEGNQWLGWSGGTCWAATAILAYAPGSMEVSKNFISGNSDVGIFVLWAEGGTYAKNKVFDTGIDGPMTGGTDPCFGDVGIYDLDSNGTTFTKNLVRGFDFAFYPDPLSGDKNRELPPIGR